MTSGYELWCLFSSSRPLRSLFALHPERLTPVLQESTG